jgi:hypothetical protein
MVLHELFPLSFRVLAVQVDKVVGRLNLAGDLHLGSGIGSEDELGSAVLPQELRKQEAGGSSADDQDFRTDSQVEDVGAVKSARGRFLRKKTTGLQSLRRTVLIRTTKQASRSVKFLMG